MDEIDQVGVAAQVSVGADLLTPRHVLFDFRPQGLPRCRIIGCLMDAPVFTAYRLGRARECGGLAADLVQAYCTAHADDWMVAIALAARPDHPLPWAPVP